MAVTSMSGIEGMLQQMRAVVQTAQGRGVTDAELAPRVGGSFASELQRSLQKVSSAQMAASDQAKAFQLGKPGVALNDVMIDLQKASIGFQTVVQVRNKLVSAYKEISSMAV